MGGAGRAALALALACAPALTACGASDEDEVRAVAQEFRRALDTDDGARACRLLTPHARAAFTDCAANVASMGAGAGARGPVTIRDGRTTIGTPASAGRVVLLKVDGSWRIDKIGPSINAVTDALARQARYAVCWRAAGAKIATSAAELAFAAADRPVIAVRADRASAKGGDWRIFYVLPSTGRQPNFADVLAHPDDVGVVAYVRNASEHRGVVERARACTPDG